jgi:hypothetical protein
MAPQRTRPYHVFRFLFFRLWVDGGAKVMPSPLSSPCIFRFAVIVTDSEPVALLRSATVASASFAPGRTPQWRMKHETKKPFVESSSGEHRRTASVALPII